jgi:hypothetical protein
MRGCQGLSDERHRFPCAPAGRGGVGVFGAAARSGRGPRARIEEARGGPPREADHRERQERGEEHAAAGTCDGILDGLVWGKGDESEVGARRERFGHGAGVFGAWPGSEEAPVLDHG